MFILTSLITPSFALLSIFFTQKKKKKNKENAMFCPISLVHFMSERQWKHHNNNNGIQLSFVPFF